MTTTAKLTTLVTQHAGALVGAVIGALVFAIALSAPFLVGAFYGALMGLLLQTLAQNWVPFDFSKITNYVPPEPEWKKPGHVFDNSVATETGETVSNTLLAKIMAAVMAVAFFGLMTFLILSSARPIWAGLSGH